MIASQSRLVPLKRERLGNGGFNYSSNRGEPPVGYRRLYNGVAPGISLRDAQCGD